MTLMNERKKRIQQTLQQVKELARAQQWQEAKQLVDSLPDTPDVVRVREKIVKQLFISTGEIPALMEGSPSLAGMESDGSIAKRAAGSVPSYWPIRIVAYIAYGGGVFAIVFGLVMTIWVMAGGNNEGGLQLANGLIACVSGLFSVASAAMMLMFVDIAQNTFHTNNLLTRLLDKDS